MPVGKENVRDLIENYCCRKLVVRNPYNKTDRTESLALVIKINIDRPMLII